MLRVSKVGSATDVQEIADSIVNLCRIARLSQNEDFTLRVENEIRHRIELIGKRQVDWSSLINASAGQIEKAVILKPYTGEKEKGAILISFENQWARLMAVRDLEGLARRYTLILAPSWSPPQTLETTLFPAQYPSDTLFSLISNVADIPILQRLSPKIIVVPLYASSWVNPEIFKPIPFEKKDIDILMLAGFGKYKRHFALFKALSKLPTSTRVVLIGQPLEQRTAATLREEARHYGVEDRFEIKESASNQEVAECLARAKISIILSKREGSCVAVVESMAANTPVGIYEDAAIGSRAFVNKHTGRFFTNGDLARQLTDFLANAQRYTPRQWVVDNGVGCRESTATLNEAVKTSALKSGEHWTQDLAIHYWRPDPTLLKAEDQLRLQPAYDDIRDRFGLTIGNPART
jgi:glycosyltransferase involved in cell wall biosynthesis